MKVLLLAIRLLLLEDVRPYKLYKHKIKRKKKNYKTEKKTKRKLKTCLIKHINTKYSPSLTMSNLVLTDSSKLVAKILLGCVRFV